MWNYLQGQVYLTRIASDGYVDRHYLGRKLNAYHFSYILNPCNHPHNLSNNFRYMLALFFFSICGLQHDLIYSCLAINTLQPIEYIQKVKLWVGEAKELVNYIWERVFTIYSKFTTIIYCQQGNTFTNNVLWLHLAQVVCILSKENSCRCLRSNVLMQDTLICVLLLNPLTVIKSLLMVGAYQGTICGHTTRCY